MTAPYRDPPSDEARRVIARRSASNLALHLLLALAGLATPALANIWGTKYPAFYVLAFIAFPTGLLALGRTLHAWFLPHAVELGPRGLRFAWAEKVTLMPWMRGEDREVPWSALREVKTHTVSVNGASTTTLVVSTDEGSFCVPDAIFDQTAGMMQREILDYLDRARERPVGHASAFVQACRERFAEPLRFTARPTSVLVGAAFLLVFGGFFVWLALEVPMAITYSFAAVTVLLFGGLTARVALTWARERVLVLSPEALSLGSRTIPWATIRTVRRSVTNGKTDGVEIIQADGSRTLLHLDYGRPLEEIARLIDPALVPGR